MRQGTKTDKRREGKGPTQAEVRAAIYCRISKDREGAGLGVDRQEADCRALAERMGWEVVAVFVDNDISAYSGKRRPQYEALMKTARLGQFDAVIVWHPDRLHRRAVELEAFIDLIEETGIQVQTVQAGAVDLTTASGRMVARVVGAAAQHEVDHARERMTRAKAQAAADGRWRGGPRPYGYETDGTVREVEAQVLRDATAGVLAGRSLRSLAFELNEAGRVTSTGKPWTYQRLRDVLLRPRNCALVSVGRPERGSFEIVGPASWPAIVSEDEWRAVLALLTDPSRRIHDSTRPRWLGSNTYVCGKCGAMMRTTSTSGLSSPRYYYVCRESNHLAVAAPRSDNYVRGVVAEMVRDPRIAAALTPDDGRSRADRERRAALVARLDGFESDYAEGNISGAQLAKATARVEEELAQIDARMTSQLQTTAASSVLNAVDPGAVFLAAPVDVQRAVVRALVRITVEPARYRGTGWRPERLRLEPVAQGEPAA